MAAILVDSSWGMQTKQVAGRWYEEEDSTWYVLDFRGERWEIARGFIEIKFLDGTSASEKEAVREGTALTRARKSNALGYERHTYNPSRDPIEVLQSICASVAVERAYLNTKIKFFSSANDTLFSQQWYLPHIGVDSAWDVTTGLPSVVVAVIDGGVDYEHEDLEANIWLNPGEIPGDSLDNDNDASWYESPMIDDIYGWDFLDDDDDPRPGPGDKHGTPCAGIVSATRNNRKGVAGVAGGDDGVGPRLVVLRTGHDGTVADALEYSWRKGVDVVSMSIGVNDPEGCVAAQLDSAYSHGLVLVAAAGNYQFQGAVAFPASHPLVIAVGATDVDDEWLSYSSYGQTLEITAPSGIITGPEPQIFTTDNYQIGADYNPSYCACPAVNDRYFSKFGGTSASAPQVAGVAALLLSHKPSLRNSDVRLLLARSAVDIGDPGWDELTGYGRVDAFAAITMADQVQIMEGPITTNTTWSGTLWVAGDVTVSSGTVLTVDAGTTVLIDKSDGQASGFYPAKIELNIEGSIDVNGTANAPVTFRSFDGQAGDWIGFYFDAASGGGSFDHVGIEDAEYGVETYVGIQVNDATFTSCAYAGIVAQDGSSQVTSTTIKDCGAWGVYNTAPGTDTLRASSCFVHGAAAAAFHVQNGSTSLLDGVTGRNGVKGVHIAPLATASISNSTFSVNDIGVHCYGGTVMSFTSSHADTNASEGLLCDGGVGLAIITGSSFDANESGIVALNNSQLYIRGCQLNVNCIGMWCAYGGEADAGTVSDFGNNSVVGTTTKHVANFTEEYTFPAIGNWWDQYPPSAKKFQNAVDYMPALTEPPGSMMSLSRPPGEPPASVPNGFIGTMPNPFNPAITVVYGVRSPAHATLAIYNVNGQVVADLLDERKPAGRHVVTWGGADRKGRPVASGVYFARLTVGGLIQTRKIVLLK